MEIWQLEKVIGAMGILNTLNILNGVQHTKVMELQPERNNCCLIWSFQVIIQKLLVVIPGEPVSLPNRM